jgi:IclR family transcriptional regulator, acetate operon repressor
VKAMTTVDGPAYPIDSVDRALSLILAFEAADRITVTEAGKFLGVSRSTAYRLLSVLEYRDFATQDPQTKAFHPGPALLRAGLAVAQRSDIRVTLRPLLDSVVAEVNETAHLVVLQRNEAFYLDCVESTHVVRATGRVGTSLPAHVSAGGKVLLANLRPAVLDEILTGKLAAVTKRSRTSVASVRRELVTVSKAGYAINNGESEVGLRAVAILVPARVTGTVDAAITVAGPSERMDPRAVEAIIKALHGKVQQFSAT